MNRFTPFEGEIEFHDFLALGIDQPAGGVTCCSLGINNNNSVVSVGLTNDPSNWSGLTGAIHPRRCGARAGAGGIVADAGRSGIAPRSGFDASSGGDLAATVSPADDAARRRDSWKAA